MAETIDLTAATTRVRLRAGETVRLCLVESPSTGFLWARVGDLPPGLVEVENTFAPEGPGIGGSGRRCITYRFAGTPAGEAAAKARGAPEAAKGTGAPEAVVTFVLRRSWETAEPATPAPCSSTSARGERRDTDRPGGLASLRTERRAG